MSPPYTDIEAYGVDTDMDMDGEQITKEQDEEIMKKKERQVNLTFYSVVILHLVWILLI